MKPILSWLLLGIVSLHWVGSHVYIAVQQIQETTYQMNEAEQLLADFIADETDIETHIQVINLAENTVNIEEIGYSGLFIFNQEIDGQTVHYTINKTTKNNEKEVLFQSKEDKPNSNQTQLFQQFFPKLFYQVATFLSLDQTPTTTPNNFRVKTLRHLFQIAIPSPPPNFG